jgi:hypothetical protein
MKREIDLLLDVPDDSQLKKIFCYVGSNVYYLEILK